MNLIFLDELEERLNSFWFMFPLGFFRGIGLFLFIDQSFSFK